MKYDFKAVEAKWQKVWQDEHSFHAEIDHSKPTFLAVTISGLMWFFRA